VLAVSAVSAACPATSRGGGTATSPAAGAGLRLKALREIVGRNFRVSVDATSAQGTKHLVAVRGTFDVSADHVTVTLPDNSTQAFTVDSSTIVRDRGRSVPFSSLTDGQRALVLGVRNDDGSSTARLIRIPRDLKPATP
jgi:hypothetical protein